MSTRFGIELVFDPSFTSRAYRARQLICGQYAAWAAEMHMLSMSVVGYFQCSDTVVDLLAHGISRVAEDSRNRNPQFTNNWLGVTTNREEGGVSLDFQHTDLRPLEQRQVELGRVGQRPPGPSHPMASLHLDTAEFIQELAGASLPDDAAGFRPRIKLLEYSNLPPPVLADAAEFARGISIDLPIPAVARAWRLMLLRYSSDAAGEDWSSGAWAADLRWECLASYVL